MPPAVCNHTQRVLQFSDRLGSQFGLCDLGCVFNLKARNLDYGSDYFLAEYRNQYGRTYLEDEPAIRALARRRLHMIRKYVAPPARVLEIGAATGFFLDEARKFGYETTGWEISEYASRYAREILKLDVQNVSFPPADLPQQQYDVVAAFYVIEHFADQRLVFQKIADLLRPGGVFCFAMPSFHGPAFECRPDEWVRTHPVDHFVDYSPSGLRKVFPVYGMRLRRVWPASYHPERGRGWRASTLMRPFYRRMANFDCYGDTMEGVAEKIY